jgi:hypothetical protein
MVIHFPRLFASPDKFGTPRPAQKAQPEGLGGRVLDGIREAFCGLHGHDAMVQFEQERMFLKCVSCGHESPGWELNEPRPIVSAQTDTRRHAPVRRQQPIADTRRIA